jgi:hypothetical protein
MKIMTFVVTDSMRTVAYDQVKNTFISRDNIKVKNTGTARLQATIGEHCFSKAFPEAVDVHTQGDMSRDFIIGNLSVDVKTHHVRVGWIKSSYWCSIEVDRIHPNFNGVYVWAFIDSNFSKLALVGWISVKEFMEKSVLEEAGSELYGGKGTLKGSRRKIRIRDLNEMDHLRNRTALPLP